ncbi:MAG: FkbM family methyltransferase [bacterium]|nr:FkbM family methyltransferase [bacterium]
MNVRSAWRRLFPAGPAVIGAGPGRGLRFDVGGGNPDFAAGTYEPPVQQALADCLKPGDVVLDVGANVGFIAVIAAKLVGPAGRVVAFEPVPENARLVRRNARLNGLSRLEVVETAVGDRCGSAQLVLARLSGGSALAGTDLPPDACGEIEVPLTTLDAWHAREPATRPALVKIDVEGAELAVLRGAVGLLAAARPMLLLEVDDADAALAEAKAAACGAFCEDHGYRVGRLPDAYPDIAWCVIHMLATPR